MKNKVSSDGKAPVYLRITVNGKRCHLSIKRKIDLEKWNSKTGTTIGNSIAARELNNYLEAIRFKLYGIQKKFLDDNKSFSALDIKNSYIGKSDNEKMVLSLFQDHNDKVEKLIGKDFSHGTAERYRTARKHVQDYINLEYACEDIRVKDIDHKFISGLEYYLKTVRNCAHNTTIKYITNFKKIIRIAYANEWIDKDPFFNWKAKLKVVDREFLTQEEIQIILDKKLHTQRLEQVRDIFIFCCYTGLSYSDVKKLSKDNLVKGIDGEMWIKTFRTKTDTPSNIPLLPTAMEILEKYKNHLEVINKDILLPVLSNQKSNAYLKEIADLSGISKNLTTHLARHTFATTITLSNGVPIESVSKMLGHKSLKTTQHYAKILDRKVSEDMTILKSKLGQSTNKDKNVYG
ncbi:site-specific integrase [Aureibaculum sp. 2210JD6-5]|uniref:site-specific integrase n=1 Tax=Aureibaculum sp. 2210JD6-5 TaxID=3103957 RepID=UPI002AAD3C55|nr:site-specific integrase [Aureibaculum sp. 2210JD6-5]MDY7395011.1 site-specific integrase [Aureibaculum sp. 2210JD6-5]